MFGLSKPSKTTDPATTNATSATNHHAVAPRCDIHETPEAVVILADMPGVGGDGVEVRLYGDTLTLTGRSTATTPADFSALWQEYAIRDFERTFRLGHDVDPEQVQAQIRDGVLRIELKKRAAAQPRKISVSAG